MSGYIKLYRSLLDWEWYKNIPVRILFEHCLLRANHKENKWQGKIIKKGSFITSLDNLAFETGLTKMQVRTALNKLKSTHEITHEGHSQYSIISIKNWSKYQQDNTQINTQITHKQHTDNTQITLNKNEKNDKNDKKERLISALSQNSNFLNYDLMYDENVNKVFDFYEKNCKALVPLIFERRDIELRQAIHDFLIFIDFDFFYFSELCQKANKQVNLLDNKIDLKSLIKNHSRIYSGFFENKKADVKKSLTTADIVAKVKARKEAQNDT